MSNYIRTHLQIPLYNISYAIPVICVFHLSPNNIRSISLLLCLIQSFISSSNVFHRRYYLPWNFCLFCLLRSKSPTYFSCSLQACIGVYTLSVILFMFYQLLWMLLNDVDQKALSIGCTVALDLRIICMSLGKWHIVD